MVALERTVDRPVISAGAARRIWRHANLGRGREADIKFCTCRSLVVVIEVLSTSRNSIIRHRFYRNTTGPWGCFNIVELALARYGLCSLVDGSTADCTKADTIICERS